MAEPHEVAHGHLLGKICKLLTDHPDATNFIGEHDSELNPIFRSHPYKAGQLVKVTMVSRFGDCGVTDDLQKEFGYDIRVKPEELEIVN